jgi:hypothetical protein
LLELIVTTLTDLVPKVETSVGCNVLKWFSSKPVDWMRGDDFQRESRRCKGSNHPWNVFEPAVSRKKCEYFHTSCGQTPYLRTLLHGICLARGCDEVNQRVEVATGFVQKGNANCWGQYG